MDRLSSLSLSLVACLSLALAACEEQSAPAAPSSRVIAVAPKKQTKNLADLCDVQPEAGSRPFTLPELSEDSASPAASGWRWVNVWATWCKPCIEELPLIESTLETLKSEGTPVQFVAVSADADAEPVAKFVERFTVLEGTSRFADPEQVPQWATKVGLDEGATLPLHVFVDPAGNVRCARAGAVSEHDMTLVSKLVR